MTIKITFTHRRDTNGVILQPCDNKLVFHQATLESLFLKVSLIDGYDLILQKQPARIYIKSIIHELTQSILSRRQNINSKQLQQVIVKNYGKIYSICFIDIHESNPGRDT